MNLDTPHNGTQDEAGIPEGPITDGTFVLARVAVPSTYRGRRTFIVALWGGMSVFPADGPIDAACYTQSLRMNPEDPLPSLKAFLRGLSDTARASAAALAADQDACDEAVLVAAGVGPNAADQCGPA